VNSRAAVREHLFDGIGNNAPILEGGLLKMECMKEMQEECTTPGRFYKNIKALYIKNKIIKKNN